MRPERRSLADRVASAQVTTLGVLRWLGRHPMVVLGVILGLAVIDSILGSLG